MFRASLISASDEWLRNLQQVHEIVPDAVEKYTHREVRPFVSQRIDKTLRRDPGPVRYPIQWTSDKQRRYVMAKLRKEGNLPYKRTWRYVKGWRVRANYKHGLTSIAVYHEDEVADFIGGRRQQQYHHNTGWANAADTLQDLAFDVEDFVQAGLARVVREAFDE